MKKIFALTVLLLSIQSYSQTYIKANALSALVAIPDVAVETSIGEKLTLNIDLMGLMACLCTGSPSRNPSPEGE